MPTRATALRVTRSDPGAVCGYLAGLLRVRPVRCSQHRIRTNEKLVAVRRSCNLRVRERSTCNRVCKIYAVPNSISYDEYYITSLLLPNDITHGQADDEQCYLFICMGWEGRDTHCATGSDLTLSGSTILFRTFALTRYFCSSVATLFTLCYHFAINSTFKDKKNSIIKRREIYTVHYHDVVIFLLRSPWHSAALTVIGGDRTGELDISARTFYFLNKSKKFHRTHRSKIVS